MKALKIILLVLATFCTVVNVALFFTYPDVPTEYANDGAYLAGYYFGKTLFLLFGAGLYYLAYRIHKKQKRKKLESLYNTFLREENA